MGNMAFPSFDGIVACRSCLSTIHFPKNYFYLDRNNLQHGPVNEQQLRELASRRVIGPNTSVVTDTGHLGIAGQIPGLFDAMPSPFSQMPQATHQPYQATGFSLDAKQRKGRIHFWTVMCTFTIVLYTLAGILSGAMVAAIPEIEKEIRKNSQVQLPGMFVRLPDMFGMQGRSISTVTDAEIKEAAEERVYSIVFILLAITGVPYLFCYYYYLLRLWEEMPGEFSRTTPGNAAGFALIPIFHLFWLFTVFGGLYRDMNKTMASYGHRFPLQFGEGWITAICVSWVALFAGGILLGILTAEQPVANGGFAILISILGFLLTVPTYWIIRRDVFAFIDNKSSNGR